MRDRRNSGDPGREVLDRLYNHEGKSLEEIGAIYGRQANTVSCWMTKHGLKRRTISAAARLRRPSQEELYRLRYQTGMTQAKLAQHFGVSMKTIYNWEKPKAEGESN